VNHAQALIGLSLACLLASFSATGLIRRYAGIDWQDPPGHRRSHRRTTPRPGGIAFLLVWLGAVSWLLLHDYLPLSDVSGLLGGAVVVAVGGLLDDRFELRPGDKIFFHLLGAGWFVYVSGFPDGLQTGFGLIPFGMFKIPLALAGFVSLTNVYNFMDGSHGLAALQAVFVALALAAWFVFQGDVGLALVAFTLAISVAGFLPWNFPGGRVFMGDVGSGFLGFALAGLVVLAAQRGEMPMMVGALLLGLFLADSTTTLVHRWRAGRRWYTPHREHLYQVLIRGGWSHTRVALAYSAANLFLVLPLAVLAGRWPSLMLPAIVAFGVVFVLVWRRVRSGFGNRRRALRR